MEQYKDDADRPRVPVILKKEINPLDTRIAELEEKLKQQASEIERIHRELGRMKNHINMLSKAMGNVR
jgi:predicted RNase H-like nuclease (RuvC/YqgF family)